MWSVNNGIIAHMLIILTPKSRICGMFKLEKFEDLITSVKAFE